MCEQPKPALPAEVLQGYGVGSRSVRGAVTKRECQQPSDPEVSESFGLLVGDSEGLREALERVAQALEHDASETTSEISEILDAQAMMAQDPTLVTRVMGSLQKSVPSDLTGKGRLRPSQLLGAFTEVADVLRRVGGYIGERADDVVEIGQRVIADLYSRSEVSGGEVFAKDAILVFQELSASDASKLDPNRVVGVVVETGGPTGHVALILRALDIPALVGCRGAINLAEGTEVELVPARGLLYIGSFSEADLLSSSGTDIRRRTSRTILANGSVHLLANVGSISDAELAAELGAEGIGLVRTEFLFGNGEQEPSQEQQIATYRGIVGPFEGSRATVTFRTLDVGSDKPLSFLSLDREANPALGVRGFRLIKRVPNVIEGQLEALVHTQNSSGGISLKVMAPMVATLEEARRFVKLGRSYGLSSLGVMIEVPALALGYASVAPEVDFASLGTNDLVQYLMGADRNEPSLVDLLDPWNPVVLKLIASVARDSARSGTPLSVCGESASDPELAAVLVGLGVTGLSMAPRSIAGVRELLMTVSRTAANSLARLALRQHDAVAARQAVKEALRM